MDNQTHYKRVKIIVVEIPSINIFEHIQCFSLFTTLTSSFSIASKYESKQMVFFFEDETQIVIETLLEKLESFDFSKVAANFYSSIQLEYQ